ncbi:MAG: AIM24 family protein, partial [Gaiellaceae bacterium]
LIVDTGCMVMVEPTVGYDVKMQGGVAKSLFGGEGLFLVHMTGPGHVTLQTLPFSRTARRVLAAASGGSGDEGGGIGSMLGGILE